MGAHVLATGMSRGWQLPISGAVLPWLPAAYASAVSVALVPQGQRHADTHSQYWLPRVQQLTQHWCTFERSAGDCFKSLELAATGPGATTNASPPLRCYDMMLYLLEDRQTKRDEFHKRASHPTYAVAVPARDRTPAALTVLRLPVARYRTLDKDFQPVLQANEWLSSNKGPLPEDLSAAITQLKALRSARARL